MTSYLLLLIVSLAILTGLFFLRKRFKSLFLRYGIVGIQALYVFFIVFLFEEPLQNIKYSVHALVSNEYQKNVELIRPYFDEEFYLSSYGDVVKESGLSPIDHFLQRGWHNADWREHTDPNPWFNTTLYQERLWPVNRSKLLVDDNPFVDFLKQSNVGTHSETLQVYANANELERAFYAVEGLLRLGKYNVELHIPGNLETKGILRFEPQVSRGLKLIQDNAEGKSFYQSEFLKSPDRFIGVTPAYVKEAKQKDHIRYSREEFPYSLHRFYHFKWWKQRGWIKQGYINPMLLNIAHYCDEPLIFMGYSDLFLDLKKFVHNILSGVFEYPEKSSPKDFTDYVVRIASGFDMCLFNTKLPISNLKLIPGYLHSFVDETELDSQKQFEVSFLLSLGQSLGKCDLKSYRAEQGFRYGDRVDVWNHQEDFVTPIKFYVSSRDKETFPEDLQKSTLPTNSKKWLFNSQYHIAIENTQQQDYFTEKVLDCFVSKTVPIYLGCPNIGDYFDVRGMIIVDSTEQIIEAVNNLTPESYDAMRPYIEENYRRAKEILTLENDTILELGSKMSPEGLS